MSPADNDHLAARPFVQQNFLKSLLRDDAVNCLSADRLFLGAALCAGFYGLISLVIG